MRITEILASDHLDQAHDLIVAHWNEVSRIVEPMPPKPNRELYIGLEEAGVLLSLGAFDDIDGLVGYSITVVGHDFHYADTVTATNMALYVRPDHRGSAGKQLMAETERLATERGAKLMLWHAKQNTRLADMLNARDYRIHDIVYSRELN